MSSTVFVSFEISAEILTFRLELRFQSPLLIPSMGSHVWLPIDGDSFEAVVERLEYHLHLENKKEMGWGCSVVVYVRPLSIITCEEITKKQEPAWTQY